MAESEGEPGALNPVDVAPLLTALRGSTGETRVAILEALVRLPLTPAVADEVAVPFAPHEGSPMRPRWAKGKRLGFASYPASAPRNLERPSWGWGGLKKASPVLNDKLAPAAVTRWFEWAVGDFADIGLANEIVGWIGEYQGSFHPDLEGLFVQYRRAALAECAAWSDGRRPGAWFLRDPDFESWRGYRVLCWQIGWTVSRGGLRGLATGLAHRLAADDETDRVVAALLIADAGDYILQAHPAMFGGGRGPAPRPPVGSADVSRLPHLLREAARAGIVPEPRVPEAGGEGDDVQCTVFAPPAASTGGSILVQVFAHLIEEADDALAIASELDSEARRRAFRSLDARVPLGSRVDFELRLPGLEIDDPVASLTWRRRTEAVQFGVRIPWDTAPGAVIGTLFVSLDAAPVGHVKFTLTIAAAAAEPAQPQGDDVRHYRYAFISYASHDRDEVLQRVQILSPVGIEYFQDVLSLDPGERWTTSLERAISRSDVFLLFWSSHAKASQWVRKEVDYALKCKEGDDGRPPEIRPVILEGPPIVPPWDDLAHLHFNDRVLYFMRRPH